MKYNEVQIMCKKALICYLSNQNTRSHSLIYKTLECHVTSTSKICNDSLKFKVKLGHDQTVNLFVYHILLCATFDLNKGSV